MKKTKKKTEKKTEEAEKRAKKKTEESLIRKFENRVQFKRKLYRNIARQKVKKWRKLIVN